MSKVQNNNSKTRVALVAAFDPKLVLSAEEIKPRFRSRLHHPMPWLAMLAQSFTRRDDIEFHIFSHARSVSHVCRGRVEGVDYTFIPQYEPGQCAPWHLHAPARMQFKSHLSAYAPDVVHGFGTEGAYGLIAADQDVPSVLFIQGIMDFITRSVGHKAQWRDHLLRYLERKALKAIDGIVAETAFAEKWARSLTANAVIRVIPHGVQSDFFDEDPSFYAGHIHCLCVARLAGYKAVDVAIRAFAKVRDRRVHLDILGDGKERPVLEELADELGIAERVRFWGMVNRADLIQVMRKGRILLLTTRMDTSPNALTEAHAAGLPVIGTRVGGIPDMIEEGCDGFLVDVDDEQGIADRIDRLVADPALCEAMGFAGREKVRILNDPDRIAEEHLQFYREVVSKSAK